MRRAALAVLVLAGTFSLARAEENTVQGQGWFWGWRSRTQWGMDSDQGAEPAFLLPGEYCDVGTRLLECTRLAISVSGSATVRLSLMKIDPDTGQPVPRWPGDPPATVPLWLWTHLEVSAGPGWNVMDESDVVQATFQFSDGEYAHYSADLHREEELGPGWRALVSQAVHNHVVTPWDPGPLVLVRRWLAPSWEELGDPDWHADTGGDYEVSLTVSIEPNEPPVAVATAEPLEVNVGEPVTFSGAGSFDPNDDPLTFHWEFSDGAMAEGVVVQHTFAEPGVKSAMLMVEDGRYAYDIAFVEVMVKTANEPPVAALAAEPELATVGQEVTFHTDGTSDPDGDALSYTLNFGDGTPSAQGTLSPPYADLALKHTYEEPGEYTARLTVSDGQAAPVSASCTVTQVGVEFDRNPVIVGVAKTETVTATIVPGDYYGDISFSITDASLATVSPTEPEEAVQELSVKGLKPGVTTLVASYDGQACGRITVKVGKADFVRITPDPGILTPGERMTFTAVGFATVGQHPPLPHEYSPDLSTPVGTVVAIGQTRGVFLGPVPVNWKLGGPQEPEKEKAEAYIPVGVPTDNVTSVEVKAAGHAEGEIRPDLFCDGLQDKSNLLAKIAGVQPGVIDRPKQLPVASDTTKGDLDFQSYQLRVYLAIPYKAVKGNLGKLALRVTRDGKPTTDAGFTPVQPAMVAQGPRGLYGGATAHMYALKPGTYGVEITFDGKDIDGGKFSVDAVGAKLAFEPDGPIMQDTATGPCAVMPLGVYEDENATEPTNLVAVGTLVPEPADREVKFELAAAAKKHTVVFVDGDGKEFVEVKRGDEDGKEPETKVTLDPTREAEGNLVVSGTLGVYLLKAKYEFRKVAADGSFGPWNDPQHVPEKKGSIAPLAMICPNIDILTPDGDPTKRGAGGANADNEPVYDDSSPQLEDPGECVIWLEAKLMENLSEESRELVSDLLFWHLPLVGGVPPKYSEASGIGRAMYVKYIMMPQDMADFGPKTVTLTLGDRPWEYYQKIEMFFHYAGSGNPGGAARNWFYYWKQIVSPQAGPGNPQGVKFEFGQKWMWKFRGVGNKTLITAGDPQPISLSDFVGMLAHEQKHETDFWKVVWQEGGVIANDDRDNDKLRDDWERTQPMADGTGYGPWTFDVLANPPKPAVPGTNAGKDTAQGGVSFETQIFNNKAVLSWGDKRADVAAKDEVNANKNIDAQDWSDRRFPPPPYDRYRFDYADEDVPGDQETTDWITQKNNKDS